MRILRPLLLLVCLAGCVDSSTAPVCYATKTTRTPIIVSGGDTTWQAIDVRTRTPCTTARKP